MFPINGTDPTFFYVLKLLGACEYVFEDLSAICWSFNWSIPW